jgi:hypothetical protein
MAVSFKESHIPIVVEEVEGLMAAEPFDALGSSSTP